MSKIVLRYFSATGNSQYIAEKIAEKATLAGRSTDCQSIESKEDMNTFSGTETLVLVSPVLGFAPVTFMIEYVQNIASRCASVYLVTACGAMMGKNGVSKGYPGGSFALLETILKKKGLVVTGTAAISLPDNFTQVFNPPSADECDKIFEETATEIDTLAKNIIEGRSFSFPMASWARMIFKAGSPIFLQMGRFGLMHLFIADHRCNGCGLCAKKCPAQAISVRDNFPVWKSGCSGCGRCINICPKRAIQTSLPRLLTSLILPIAIQVIGAWWWAGVLASWGMSVGISWAVAILFMVLITIPLNRLYIEIAQPILSFLEKIPFVRSINSIGHTKKYNRYHATNVRSINQIIGVSK